MAKNYGPRLIIAGLLVILFVVMYQMGIMNYLTINYFQERIESIKIFIDQHYVAAALSFFGLLVAGVSFSLPLGVVMPVVGGFLFGWIPGALISIVGAALGAIISFLAARYLIGDFFQEKFSDRLEKFNKELDEYGFLYLLGLHFFPITPFFVLNILTAMTRLPLFTFVWTTFVGLSPSFIIYSYFGSSVSDLNDIHLKNIIIPLILLKILSATTLLVGRFGKRFIKPS